MIRSSCEIADKNSLLFLDIKENSTICNEAVLCFPFKLTHKSLNSDTVKQATLVLHSSFKSLIHPRVGVKITFIPLPPSKLVVGNLRTQSIINFAKSGPAPINVTKFVHSLLNAGVSKCLLKLSLYTSPLDKKENERANSAVNLRLSPLLIFNVEENVKIRERRNIECDTNKCCRRKLYISFKELGWDNWILQPRGFYTNYCKGKCFKSSTIPARPGEQIVLAHLARRKWSKYAQCCTPTKFSGMSILYYDVGGYIFRKYIPDMIIEECACS